jgi:8-oxo-dGTP diphosphatase
MFTVGAFALIFDDQRRVLLCHRRDLDFWNLPGGGLEPGELPTEAVRREVMEETGLEVAVEKLVGVYGKVDKDELVFTFLCTVIGGKLTVTAEASECRYFDFGNIPLNTVPKQVERIQDSVFFDGQTIFRRQTAPSTNEMMDQLKSP